MYLFDCILAPQCCQALPPVGRLWPSYDDCDGDYDDDHDDTKRGSLGDGVVQGQQDSHRQLCVQAALPGILEGEDFFTSVDVKVD